MFSRFKVNAYPNPFTEHVVIECNLNEANRVILDVYNIYGQRVTRLSDQMQQAESVSLYWKSRSSAGNELAPDHYFCRIRIDNDVVVKKLVYNGRIDQSIDRFKMNG